MWAPPAFREPFCECQSEARYLPGAAQKTAAGLAHGPQIKRFLRADCRRSEIPLGPPSSNREMGVGRSPHGTRICRAGRGPRRKLSAVGPADGGWQDLLDIPRRFRHSIFHAVTKGRILVWGQARFRPRVCSQGCDTAGATGGQIDSGLRDAIVSFPIARAGMTVEQIFDQSIHLARGLAADHLVGAWR